MLIPFIPHPRELKIAVGPLQICQLLILSDTLIPARQRVTR